MLGLSGQNRTELRHLPPVNGKLVQVDQYGTDGVLLGHLTENSDGISSVLLIGDKPEARTIAARESHREK